MATTIIDKLVVELGLDPKQFTKGQKEAAAAIIDTEKKTSESAAKMVSSLRRVAVEFAGLFLAVKSFKDVVGWMKELNEETRQLGFDSRNSGESAATLKDLGNAAEIAGGKAEDATATVLGLQKAIFSAQHGLGWSDQLTEFQRLGVDTGANTGQMRPILDILRETSKALAEQFPDKAQRFQETQVLGLPGGIANLVGQGEGYFDKQMAIQRSIPQVTPGQTQAAQNLTQSYDVLKQRIEAIGRQVLTAIEPALEHLFKGIGDFLQKHTGDISQGIQTFLGWFSGDGPQHFIDAITAAAEAALNFAKAASGGKDVIRHPLNTAGKLLGAFGEAAHNANQSARISGEEQDAEKKYGLPAGFLSSAGVPAHNSPGMAEQIAQRLGEIRSQEVAEDDPNWLQALDTLNQQFQNASLAPDPDAAQAVNGADSSPGARAVIAGGKPTADTGSRGGAGGVSLSIDTLNVNTQADDADGIAGAITGAMNRKLSVTFADRALA